jgi:hypothetical protein
MSTPVGLLALLAGVVLVVLAADAFVDGLLAWDEGPALRHSS